MSGCVISWAFKFWLLPLNRKLLASYTISFRYSVPYAFSPLACTLPRLETVPPLNLRLCQCLWVSHPWKKRKVRTGNTQFPSTPLTWRTTFQQRSKKNEVDTKCTSEQAVETPATSNFVFIFKSLCLWCCWVVIPAVYYVTTNMARAGSGNFSVDGNFLLSSWAWDCSWITLWWLRTL